MHEQKPPEGDLGVSTGVLGWEAFTARVSFEGA